MVWFLLVYTKVRGGALDIRGAWRSSVTQANSSSAEFGPDYPTRQRVRKQFYVLARLMIYFFFK